MSHQLTKHSSGSLRELWTLALPMIFALLSGNLMMFFDRLFLANYSTAAMNAAAAAGIVAAIGMFGFATVTSIAEVFVGQYNGSKEYEKAGSPTWQMLWLSAITPFVFQPLVFYGGEYLLPSYYYHEHGLPYFQWIMTFAPAIPAVAAVSAFFIGIGRTKLVMTTTIIGNCLNLALDPLLIFGVEGWVPSLGAKGAAIATGISECVQLVILLLVFLSHHNRVKYGTSKFGFRAKLFTRCLKIGVPSSVGHMIEWAAWAVMTRIMAEIGEDHLTVAAVGQSMYMLVGFGFEGLQKAVTTLAANNIGAKRYDLVWKVWGSGIKLLAMSAIPFGFLLLVYPDPIIAEFLSLESPPEDVVRLTGVLKLACAGVWLYYILDGFTWITVGVLTAAEDTQYVMWVNGLTAWLCALLPGAFLMLYWECEAQVYWYIISFYGLSNSIAFYRRLSKEPWIKLLSFREE